MEADWEVEMGSDAPVIDACWDGLVDLRRTPELAPHLPEAQECPALGDALIRLNAASSPVWTSKCDVWPPDNFDPDELDAPDEAGKCAIACYIDLLPRSSEQWLSATQAVAACQAMCSHLRTVPLRSCRVDLIVRRAFMAPGRPEMGITAYLTACESTQAEARTTLASALGLFVEAVLAEVSRTPLQSYNEEYPGE
jgi:hypothetical protein